MRIKNRETSIQNIFNVLVGIQDNFNKSGTTCKYFTQKRANKLLNRIPNAAIKVEVNTIAQGIIGQWENETLCNKAQTNFDGKSDQPLFLYVLVGFTGTNCIYLITSLSENWNIIIKQ